jgi:hypothetical protein
LLILAVKCNYNADWKLEDDNNPKNICRVAGEEIATSILTSSDVHGPPSKMPLFRFAYSCLFV